MQIGPSTHPPTTLESTASTSLQKACNWMRKYSTGYKSWGTESSIMKVIPLNTWQKNIDKPTWSRAPSIVIKPQYGNRTMGGIASLVITGWDVLRCPSCHSVVTDVLNCWMITMICNTDILAVSRVISHLLCGYVVVTCGNKDFDLSWL